MAEELSIFLPLLLTLLLHFPSAGDTYSIEASCREFEDYCYCYAEEFCLGPSCDSEALIYDHRISLPAYLSSCQSCYCLSLCDPFSYMYGSINASYCQCASTFACEGPNCLDIQNYDLKSCPSGLCHCEPTLWSCKAMRFPFYFNQTWTGYYNCQGTQNLSLVIRDNKEFSGLVTAEFQFTHSGTKKGAFSMYGTFGNSSCLVLYDNKWIVRPFGFYAVSLEGYISGEMKTSGGNTTYWLKYQGVVPECNNGTFSIETALPEDQACFFVPCPDPYAICDSTPTSCSRCLPGYVQHNNTCTLYAPCLVNKCPPNSVCTPIPAINNETCTCSFGYSYNATSNTCQDAYVTFTGSSHSFMLVHSLLPWAIAMKAGAKGAGLAVGWSEDLRTSLVALTRGALCWLAGYRALDAAPGSELSHELFYWFSSSQNLNISFPNAFDSGFPTSDRCVAIGPSGYLLTLPCATALPYILSMPSSPVEFDFADHHYSLVAEPCTFVGCSNLAEGMTYNGIKGKLVTIDSSSENEFLLRIIGGRGVWVGSPAYVYLGAALYSSWDPAVYPLGISSQVTSKYPCVKAQMELRSNLSLWWTPVLCNEMHYAVVEFDAVSTSCKSASCPQGSVCQSTSAGRICEVCRYGACASQSCSLPSNLPAHLIPACGSAVSLGDTCTVQCILSDTTTEPDPAKWRTVSLDIACDVGGWASNFSQACQGGAKSSATQTLSTTSIVVVFGVVVPLVLLLIVAVAFWVRSRRQTLGMLPSQTSSQALLRGSSQHGSIGFESEYGLLRERLAAFTASKRRGSSSSGSGSQSTSSLLHEEPEYPRIAPHLLQMLETPLGNGFFGVVRRGVYTTPQNTQVPVAIKACSLRDPVSTENFLMEARMLHVFRHECIVSLVGVVTALETPLIVTELMKNGNLKDYLKTRGLEDGIQRVQLTYMAGQVCSALAFLEGASLVHRDIAARNVLVGESCHVKLSDFGLSRLLVEKDYYRNQGRDALPLRWMAPESVEHRMFTSKSDVWSFGVLCWEVFSYGETPYKELATSEVFKHIKRGLRLPQIPEASLEMFSLMSSCWEMNPEDRPSFATLAQEMQRLQRRGTVHARSSQHARPQGQRPQAPQLPEVPSLGAFLNREELEDVETETAL